MLLPPQYIKPYVKRGKNDAIDAAAICEAMSRPGMRFVAVKSAEQQAALMLLKVRDLLVKQRTMLINAIRGHAAEFGLIAATGPVKVAELLQQAHSEAAGVPALARALLGVLSGQLDALDVKLKALEAWLMAWHKADPVSQCLATQPGIGPIGAVSFALKVTDPKGFRSGRHFAAWLGITPKEDSTGGRCRPGRISRQGDESLRRLLVLGATARIRFAKPGSASTWLVNLLARKPKKLAAVALANKMARILWAMMVLVAHHELTWRLQGTQRDGDRSNRGSGHPGEPSGAQTSRICSGPDPRNPSGPAVDPTAHTGRTHDRNRPDPSQLQNSLPSGGRPHMGSGLRLRRPRNDGVGVVPIRKSPGDRGGPGLPRWRSGVRPTASRYGLSDSALGAFEGVRLQRLSVCFQLFGGPDAGLPNRRVLGSFGKLAIPFSEGPQLARACGNVRIAFQKCEHPLLP